MEPPVFVRGLWGGVGTPQLPKAYNEVCQLAANEQGRIVFKTFVFGRANLHFLADQGIEGVLLDERERARDDWPLSGCRWWHKLHIVKTALETHSAVMWLDWDVWAQRDLPGDFWERMATRKPFQAVLLELKHRACHWRCRGYGAHMPCYGAATYWRGPDIIREQLTIYDANRTLVDQEVFAWWLDLQTGWDGRTPQWRGFVGEDRYVADGWDPKCVKMIMRQAGASMVAHDGTFIAPVRGDLLSKHRRRFADMIASYRPPINRN